MQQDGWNVEPRALVEETKVEEVLQKAVGMVETSKLWDLCTLGWFQKSDDYEARLEPKVESCTCKAISCHV